MKKLSREEKKERILKLNKFESVSIYGWSIYIDGTRFRYHVILNMWWKLRGSYVHVCPLPIGFFGKIRNENNGHSPHERSSIDEVLETVSDDIRDTILFNLNLFR